MRQSRLIQILRVLSTKERTRFKAYTFSPFLNKNKKVQNLCVYVLKYAPKFEHEQLERQIVHRHLFKGQTYKDAQINNVISDLLQLLYQFLAYIHYEHKEAVQKNFLLEELLEREIHHDFDRVAKSYQRVQEKAPGRNYEFFLEEYHRYDKLDRFFFTKGIRSFDVNLQAKSDTLDLFYFSNKFRIACDMASRNIVTKAQYQCHFLENLLARFEEQHVVLREQPTILIYYKTLKMIREYDVEAHYYELKQLIKPNHALFPQEELRILYTYLLNYTIKKINSGQTPFTSELLDTYKAMLSDNIIFKNGYIPHWTFKNIATASIRMKAYDWTEDFILKYQKHLLPEDRENAVTFNLASLYYAKNEYSLALQQLHNVNFTNDNYHLGAKVIQIKSYYELQEFEALQALIEASKKFIGRSRQLSDYLKTATTNFVKMTKKTSQLMAKKQVMRPAAFVTKKVQLLEQLEQTNPISNKAWLVSILQTAEE